MIVFASTGVASMTCSALCGISRMRPVAALVAIDPFVVVGRPTTSVVPSHARASPSHDRCSPRCGRRRADDARRVIISARSRRTWHLDELVGVVVPAGNMPAGMPRVAQRFPRRLVHSCPRRVRGRRRACLPPTSSPAPCRPAIDDHAGRAARMGCRGRPSATVDSRRCLRNGHRCGRRRAAAGTACCRS